MRFQSIKLALLASLPLLQGAVASKWCDMPPGPYAQTRGVGLRGDTDTAGDWQCISDWQNGNLITGIEAWASEFAVEGIKFWMADGTETQWYGRGTENEHLNSHPDKPYKWDSGERVQIKLWGNKGQLKGTDDSNAVGRIQVFNKDGDLKYDVGATGKKSVQPVSDALPQDGGLIMGVKVRSQKWVSNLEFHMIKSPVTSSSLVSVKYEDDPDRYAQEHGGIEESTLADVYYKNPNKAGGSNLTYKFANTVGVKNKKVVTVAVTNLFSIGFDVETGGEFGLPGIAKASTKVSFKSRYDISKVNTDSKESEQDQSLSYEMASGTTSNMLMPQHAVHCTAKSQKGTFSSNYTGKMKCELQDGTDFSYNVKGHVETVSWTDASASCQEMALKDVPSDAKEGNTGSVPKDNNKRAVSFQA